jgi:hypothetical protein
MRAASVWYDRKLIVVLIVIIEGEKELMFRNQEPSSNRTFSPST